MVVERRGDIMPGNATLDQIVDTILAGNLADIEPLLDELHAEDRQALLCIVCSMRAEIARNCQQSGCEVSTLLTEHCRWYVNNTPTCSDPRIVHVKIPLNPR